MKIVAHVYQHWVMRPGYYLFNLLSISGVTAPELQKIYIKFCLETVVWNKLMVLLLDSAKNWIKCMVILWLLIIYYYKLHCPDVCVSVWSWNLPMLQTLTKITRWEISIHQLCLLIVHFYLLAICLKLFLRKIIYTRGSITAWLRLC